MYLLAEVNGSPRKIVIDKSGANTAGIGLVNMIRKGQFTPGLRPFQQFAQLNHYRLASVGSAI